MKCLFLLLTILLLSCTIAEDKQRLILKDGERKLLEYNAAYIPSPVKEKPYYGRSGFIHPVYSPKGKVVTDPFPKDHLHQHALMFAWTSSMIDGKKNPIWNLITSVMSSLYELERETYGKNISV